MSKFLSHYESSRYLAHLIINNDVERSAFEIVDELNSKEEQSHASDKLRSPKNRSMFQPAQPAHPHANSNAAASDDANLQLGHDVQPNMLS